MANTKAEKGGPATMTWLWMGVGIAATALFFWWVSVSSEPSQVVVSEEDAAAQAAAGDVQSVTLAELAGNPGEYLAEEVQLPSATITSVMGESAFWIEGETGPFLVVKAPEFTLRDGAAVRSGAEVRITGHFWEQSPANIEQWRETGFMAGGNLLQAEFATHYIQAREIAPAEAAPAAEPATTGQ
ncbi:MAG: hypothetical protein WEB88_10990 [Gemmatimonadota bacterium]